MSDDPEEIRTQARRAARLATEARSAAAAVSSNSSVEWHSQGAERYRKKLSDRAADFRARADDLDELSRLLYSHARHVEDHENTAKNIVKDVVKGLVPGGALL
ncbi:MAG TPA: hypothetical protein VG502_07195 [Flexivirga sp.]|uniref:hypothetical protein n=1 Tax=Flexivirga sp. TaxID=1962927 RepID=UPI002CD62D5A|nr:hypothetical protein [Flexivirga sp.]HWC22070.1 hypothetical protein [Flexivirga sp.]